MGSICPCFYDGEQDDMIELMSRTQNIVFDFHSSTLKSSKSNPNMIQGW